MLNFQSGALLLPVHEPLRGWTDGVKYPTLLLSGRYIRDMPCQHRAWRAIGCADRDLHFCIAGRYVVIVDYGVHHAIEGVEVRVMLIYQESTSQSDTRRITCALN